LIPDAGIGHTGQRRYFAGTITTGIMAVVVHDRVTRTRNAVVPVWKQGTFWAAKHTQHHFSSLLEYQSRLTVT